MERWHLSLNYETVLERDLSGSLYQLLAELYDIIPTRAVQEIEAGLSTEEENELLGIEAGSAFLGDKRTIHSQSGNPFEYVESVYRGDRYVLVAELRSA